MALKPSQVALAIIALLLVSAVQEGRAACPNKKYTSAQVSNHNKQADCWIIVSNKVYGITAWIPKHPGGKSVLTAQCGKDATSAFRNRHGSSNNQANTKLGTYCIGTL